MPKEQIEEGIRQLSRDRSSMHKVRANKQIYDLMRDGVDVNLMEHFILFDDVKVNPKKLLAHNHQYLGVNNAIEAVESIEENKGKLGSFGTRRAAAKATPWYF